MILQVYISFFQVLFKHCQRIDPNTNRGDVTIGRLVAESGLYENIVWEDAASTGVSARIASKEIPSSWGKVPKSIRIGVLFIDVPCERSNERS